MSRAQRKIIAAKGIREFLVRCGQDYANNPRKMNDVLVRFLSENNLPYMKWNPRYKGINTADLINSETVQDYWIDFRSWAVSEFGNPASVHNDKYQ